MNTRRERRSNALVIVLLCIFFIPVLSFTSPGPVHLFMIGDSTMANKPDPDHNPERGWGQVFPRFFKPGVEIHNHAVNGRSTKSFIDEGRWQKVLDSLRKGNYVLIQFAHNDQKLKDPSRYTNPYTGYRRNLVRFVHESREKGAVPILCSPVVRRKFNESGTLEDTHGAYPYVMREVATTLRVPFIDMQLMSEDLVSKMGEERSKELYMWIEPGEYAMYPDGKEDNTHFTEKGAREMAKLVATALGKTDLPLREYLKKESVVRNKTE